MIAVTRPNFSLSSILLPFLGLALFSVNVAHAEGLTAELTFDQQHAFAEPVADGDSALSFCHTAKWDKSCLLGLMIYRCSQYAFPLTPYGCDLASASLVDIIDMKRIPVTTERGQIYNLPVIFTGKLVTLIQKTSVQADIRSLRALLEYYGKEKRRFDLWEWVLNINDGDLAKSQEWLAVLLQDTSPVQIQIAYLDLEAKKGKFSEATLDAIDNLAEVSFFLSNENLTKIGYKSWLRLYPSKKNLETELTPLVYHFYPMSYMATRLKSVGFTSRLSAFLPFLFNAEYELQSLDPEVWPLRHPRAKKIDLKLDYVKWKMRDMYAGMAGALWAVDSIEEAPGLVPFQTKYAKNPFRAMQSYFWAFPRP